MNIYIPLINLSAHGGVRVLVALANRLCKAGFSVIMLVPHGKISTPYRLSDGVSVREVGFSTGYKYLDYLFFLLVLPYFLRGGIAISNFFVTFYPVKLAHIFGRVEYIYFVQDIESKYKGLLGGVLNFFCRMTYRSDKIVAGSSYLEKQLKDLGIYPVLTISVGPDRKYFETSKLGDGKKEYDVFFLLRSERWKGIDRIHLLLEEMKDRYSILCASQDEFLLDRYSSYGCVCVKPRDDEELVSLFDKSRIFVFTSYYEGFGLPPLEAMARGIPSVVFRCGGPELYINSGVDSFLVDDIDGALRAIASLLDDELLYRSVSAAANAKAHKYQLEYGLDKLVNHIRDLESEMLR